MQELCGCQDLQRLKVPAAGAVLSAGSLPETADQAKVLLSAQGHAALLKPRNIKFYSRQRRINSMAEGVPRGMATLGCA